MIPFEDSTRIAVPEKQFIHAEKKRIRKIREKVLQIQSFQDPKPKVSSANMRRKQRLNTIQIGTGKREGPTQGYACEIEGEERKNL